jgi:RNA polymerase sigma-70 factor (ECF subfamily)
VALADPLTDAQIVAQILAGNQARYRLLVERHQHAVFNVAYRLLGNRESAAEVAQEVFLRAYQALASFHLDKPLVPWLCRIAINLSLNRLKQQRSHPLLELDPSDTTFDIPDLSHEPQTQLLQAEQQQVLRRAILALPAEQRVVIELRHFQEQSYEEIALTLGLSLANVKSRLFRARQALRHILKDEL